MNRSSNIEEIANRYADNFAGKLGFGYQNLKTDETYFIHPDDTFLAASVFKVPVLIALFSLVDKGEISLSDSYTISSRDLSPGSGVLSCLSPGIVMTIRDLTVLMMIISDNTAADICLKLVGKDRVKQLIADMELTQTRVDCSCMELICRLFKNVPVEQSINEMLQSFHEGKLEPDDSLYTDHGKDNNVTTPREMIHILSELYQDKLVSKQSSREMKEIMAQCQTNSRIPSLLPDDETGNAITVIHKTGTLPLVANDCGIVLQGDTAYCITLFADAFGKMQDNKQTAVELDRMLASLSRDIYLAVK